MKIICYHFLSIYKNFKIFSDVYKDIQFITAENIIIYIRSSFQINPIALRKAKIVCNFGLSEC